MTCDSLCLSEALVLYDCFCSRIGYVHKHTAKERERVRGEREKERERGGGEGRRAS